MWPFSKFSKLEQERIETAAKLRPILDHMIKILGTSGGRFIPNNMGSGDITFKLGQQRFEFNQFGCKFEGFFIDNQQVSFEEFLDKAQNFRPKNDFTI